MFGGQPIFILSEGTRRMKGSDARKNDISAAKEISKTVRSTLGPKGMDKMLVDGMGNVVITNDGVTILKELDIEHPAAKMIIEIAETQDEECGDGTTSAVVLAGELLDRAEELIDDKIHPATIANGYRLASLKASEILEDLKIPIEIDDENILTNIAKTAMTGKTVELNKEHLAEIALKAVKKIAEEKDDRHEIDIDNVKIVKKAGASLDESELIDGIILEKERLHEKMPKKVKDAKIALLNYEFDVKKTEVDASIEITSTDQLQRFIDQEEKSIKKMVDIVKDAGADVLVCQKDIDDLAQHYLAKAGIPAFKDISKSDMKKLAKATGGKVVNNLKDLSQEDLGYAGLIHERKISDSNMTFIEGTKNGTAVSILLRGGTEHIADEVERALKDGLKVVGIAVEDKAILPGGGASDIELANRLRKEAVKVEGREQIAFEAFADSFDVIPTTLAQNAGLDGIDVLMDLNTAHQKEGQKNHGIDIDSGNPTDMIERGIIEPFRVKTQAIKSATEATNMILRIDDVIASKGFVKDEDD